MIRSVPEDHGILTFTATLETPRTGAKCCGG